MSPNHFSVKQQKPLVPNISGASKRALMVFPLSCSLWLQVLPCPWQSSYTPRPYQVAPLGWSDDRPLCSTATPERPSQRGGRRRAMRKCLLKFSHHVCLPVQPLWKQALWIRPWRGSGVQGGGEGVLKWRGVCVCGGEGRGLWGGGSKHCVCAVSRQMVHGDTGHGAMRLLSLDKKGTVLPLSDWFSRPVRTRGLREYLTTQRCYLLPPTPPLCGRVSVYLLTFPAVDCLFPTRLFVMYVRLTCSHCILRFTYSASRLRTLLWIIDAAPKQKRNNKCSSLVHVSL